MRCKNSKGTMNEYFKVYFDFEFKLLQHLKCWYSCKCPTQHKGDDVAVSVFLGGFVDISGRQPVNEFKYTK